MSSERGLGFLKRIFVNVRSRINYETGNKVTVGQDHLGHTYYEIPADPSRGIRKPRRSFEGLDHAGPSDESWSDPIPAEWQAWLRYRRDQPPTPEEVFTNMQLAEQRKRLGEEASKKLSTKEPPQSNSLSEKFPKYTEYQEHPDGDLQRLRKSEERNIKNKDE